MKDGRKERKEIGCYLFWMMGVWFESVVFVGYYFGRVVCGYVCVVLNEERIEEKERKRVRFLRE